jgi:hypothetical protein
VHRLALLLGSIWEYMTPEYIFKQMTWAEIESALDFLFRYEVKESHVKSSIKLNDWIYKKIDNLKIDLKALSKKLRGGK